VYPRIRDLTNLTGYPPLKPNIIFCVYLLDDNLLLRMDHQFKEDRKTVPTLKNSSISPRKNIFGTYLIYRLFARGRATSKHGGGGRYDAILEFKGEYLKKRKNVRRRCTGLPRRKSHKKKMNERKKERKKRRRNMRKRKNMSMHKVNSPVL
jgi:hypothetical protein